MKARTPTHTVEVTWEEAARLEAQVRQVYREHARERATRGLLADQVCDCCHEALDNLAAVQVGRCAGCIVQHGAPMAEAR